MHTIEIINTLFFVDTINKLESSMTINMLYRDFSSMCFCVTQSLFLLYVFVLYSVYIFSCILVLCNVYFLTVFLCYRWQHSSWTTMTTMIRVGTESTIALFLQKGRAHRSPSHCNHLQDQNAHTKQQNWPLACTNGYRKVLNWRKS